MLANQYMIFFNGIDLIDMNNIRTVHPDKFCRRKFFFHRFKAGIQQVSAFCGANEGIDIGGFDPKYVIQFYFLEAVLCFYKNAFALLERILEWRRGKRLFTVGCMVERDLDGGLEGFGVYRFHQVSIGFRKLGLVNSARVGQGGQENEGNAQVF